MRKAARKKSRQRAWQEDKIARNLCTRCGKGKLIHYARLCDPCRAMATANQRRQSGYKPWKKGGAGRPPNVVVVKRRVA